MSTNNNQYGKEVKPIWKNAAAESQKIMKLSGAKLQSMVSNDLAACTALTLSNRGITKLEDLVGFGDLLHRVDLSCNVITRLQGFNSTPGISMLNVSSNEIAGDASLEDLRYLTELRTLNIGNNPNIKYIRSHVAKPLQKLQGETSDDHLPHQTVEYIVIGRRLLSVYSGIYTVRSMLSECCPPLCKTDFPRITYELKTVNIHFIIITYGFEISLVSLGIHHVRNISQVSRHMFSFCSITSQC